MRQAWQCLEKIRRDVDELEKVAQLFTKGMAGVRGSLADLTNFLN